MARSRPDSAASLLAAALTVLVGLLAGCPVLPADTPVTEFSRSTANSKAKYCMYVPSNYRADRAWPMVVTLHGTPVFDSARAQAKEWRGLAEDHGFLVVAPELKSTQGVLPVGRAARLKDLDEDERRVLDILEEVRQKYNVDDKAVLITGFSAGGYPLYYIGLRHPDVFSVFIARTCNADLHILKRIPITDRTRAMPMLILFSKTGINPISSNLNPVATQSWDAYAYLRNQGCKQARIKAVSGGHHRKADRAFEFWKQHQRQLRRAAREE